MADSGDEVKIKYKPSVLNIIILNPELFQNVLYFFKILNDNTKITTKHVGKRFMYKDRVYKDNQCFVQHFIKKHLSNRFKAEITDLCIEKMLKNPEKYKIESHYRLSLNDIRKAYDVYRDLKTEAMDAIQSIKVLAVSVALIFEDPIPPKLQWKVNEDNLREIQRYLDLLPYKRADLCLTLDCDYFKTNDTGYVFDDEVIYYIIPSRYNIKFNKFHEIILKAFAFYKKTNKKIKKLIIYNPFLSEEHSIVLNDLNYDLFEKVLRRDTEKYSLVMEIKKEKQVLNLSLFESKNKEESEHIS